MKQKKVNILLCVTLMLLANIIYFVFMPYPKSFLKTMGSDTFVPDIITNLIYFMVYSVILSVAFQIAFQDNRRHSFKKYVLAVLICLGVQIGCDIVRFSADSIVGQFSPITDDIFTVITVFLQLFVAVVFWQRNKIELKKSVLIYIPIMILVLTVFIIFDFKYLFDLHNTLNKYTVTLHSLMPSLDLFDSSSTGTVISMNLQYRYEARNLILDFIAEAAFIIILCLLNNKHIPEDVIDKRKGRIRFINGLVAFLMIAPLIMGAKYFVIPQNFLGLSELNTCRNYSTNPEFSTAQITHIIKRKTGYNDYKVVYKNDHIKVYYDNKKMLDFRNDYETDGRLVEKITVCDTEVSIILSNQAVGYLKDGKPYAIQFRDLKKADEDEVLTELCKELIQGGRIDCFEDIAEYLFRFNPEFARQYINRYKESNFTSSEIENLGELSPGYIARIANQLSEKYLLNE